VAVIAGIAGVVVYGPPGWISTSPLARWKGTPPEGRRAVAEKIIESKALIGKPLDEVLRDLGPPDLSNEEQGNYEWQVGVETIMGRDEKDRPALQDQTKYLKVKLTDGRVSFVNFRDDLKLH
jgi:hypothetical protein